jgi:hypothetical protein
MRFHAGPFWEELQRKADELTHSFGGGRKLNDTERVDFIEQSSWLRGGIDATLTLVPQFRLRHREWLERSLASLVSSIHRVEGLAAISAEELAEMQREALAIVAVLDGGDLEQAENSVRALETRVDELSILAIRRDVEGRLNHLQGLLENAA